MMHFGFRVPMVVISPYAKRGYLDDAVGEFSAPLRFIADNWDLPYLTPRIRGSHDFEHVFDFHRPPRAPEPRPKVRATNRFWDFTGGVRRLALGDRPGGPEHPVSLGAPRETAGPGREGRDSNPGASCPASGFQDRRLRPLGHPPGASLAVRVERPRGGFLAHLPLHGRAGEDHARRPPGRERARLLYRNLVEQMPAVVYIDSNEVAPRSLYVSPQSVAVFGRRPAEFLADRELWGLCIHPDDRQGVFDAWEAAVRGASPFEAEYRWVRPDGRVLWVHDASVLVRGEGGQPLFWQGLIQDITASRAAERALRDLAARYQFLVENIPAVVYMVAPDDDRRTLYVSPQIERALGYTREEWLDQPDIWMELLHPDDREPTLADHDEHNESGRPWTQEYRLIASDGRAVWFHDVANLVRDEGGRPLYWLGVQTDVTQLRLAQDELRAARDDLELRVRERTSELEEANELMSLEISERLRAETELRVAKQRYRALAENIPAVTYIWEVEPAPGSEPLFYTSPRIEQMLGYTVEEWHAGHDFCMSRVHPDDREEVDAASVRSETTGEPFSMEYRYLHKDGHIVWVLDQAVLVSRGADGRPALFQGLMTDITERKEAEALAHESDLRYRSLAEQVPAITWVFDPVSARTTYVSPQLTTMLGYEPEEWGTIERWLETVHPGDRERMRRFAAGVVGSNEGFEVEYRVLRRDGTVRWLQARGAVLSRDASGRVKEFQGLVVDVTSTRHAHEEQLEASALYRSLVEQIPAATYIELAGSSADDVHLSYLSPQIEGIFGRSAEDLLADPGHFAKLLHPDDRERVLRADDRSRRDGRAVRRGVPHRPPRRDRRMGAQPRRPRPRRRRSAAVLARRRDGHHPAAGGRGIPPRAPGARPGSLRWGRAGRFELGRLGDRQPEPHGGPDRRPRPDVEGASGELDPLAHRAQPEVLGVGVLARREPDAVVLDLHDEIPAIGRRGSRARSRPSSACGRSAAPPAPRGTPPRGSAAAAPAPSELRTSPVTEVVELVREVLLDRRGQPAALERRRPQLEHQVPQPRDRVLDGGPELGQPGAGEACP